MSLNSKEKSDHQFLIKDLQKIPAFNVKSGSHSDHETRTYLTEKGKNKFLCPICWFLKLYTYSQVLSNILLLLFGRAKCQIPCRTICAELSGWAWVHSAIRANCPLRFGTKKCFFPSDYSCTEYTL